MNSPFVPAANHALSLLPTFKQVMDSLGTFSGLLQRDGTVIAANAAALLVAQLNPEDVIGLKVEDTFWFSHDPEVQKKIREAVDHAAFGTASRFEIKGRVAENQFFIIDLTIMPVFGDDGQVSFIVPSGVDVTDRVRTEQALRRSEERLHLAVQAGRMGTWEWDRAEERLTWSESHYRLLGHEPGTIASTYENWLAQVHPDDREGAERALQAALREKKDYLSEYRVIWPDGSVHWIEVRGRVLLEKGQVTGMLGTVADMDLRKQTEISLREREQLMRNMVDGAPIPMLVSAEDGEVLYLNQAWTDATGYTQQDLPTLEHWAKEAHRERAQEVLSFIGELFDSCRIYPLSEHQISRKDGSRVTLLLSSCPLGTLPDGRKFRMTACIDISERKGIEKRLRELNETLEQQVADRTSAFKQRTAQLRRLASELTRTEQKERQRLADVLHNHLQQIITAALMRLATLDRRIEGGEGRRLIHETSDLLREAISETRSLTTQLSPPILHHSGLGPALEWLAQSKREKYGLDVTVTVDPSAEPQDDDIKTFLFEAARELLFNVVKHAGSGKAWLTLMCAENSCVRMEVADSGTGTDISAVAREESPKGFGLFSISERLEFLGGHMSTSTSTAGGFKVELVAPMRIKRQDLGRDTGGSESGATETSSGGIVLPEWESARIRLLVVDDHAIVREGIVSILQEQLDFAVVGEGGNGNEAIALVQTLQPQIVIMDINMPQLNGIEATRAIKRENPHVCVIGLSVNNDEGTARAMREAGAHFYLPKDGPSENLCEAIRACQSLVI